MPWSGCVIDVLDTGSAASMTTWHVLSRCCRIESLELKVADPARLTGTMVSGGKDGSIKYWDLHK